MLSVFIAIRTVLICLLYLWSALHGPAKVVAAGDARPLPRYCGVDGAARFDALGAPAGAVALERVQVVVRHGARTPTGACSTLVRGVSDAWACGGAVVEAVGGARFERRFEGAACEPGALTDAGYAQHRALGAALRRAYSERLGGLDARDVALRTTDLSRTRQSVETLVVAWRAADAETNDASDAEAVELETQTADKEWLYPNPAACPALRALEARAYADPTFRAWNATDPARLALDARLRDALGADFDYGLDDMAGGRLLDCVVSNVCDGRATPLAPDDVARLLAQAETREYQKLRHDRDAYSTLAAAPLARRVAAGVASGPAVRIWGAHDTTLMPLLVSLGADDGAWAPYAAAVVVETWRTGAETRGVRVVYGGRVVRDLVDADAFVASLAWADRPRACRADALVVAPASPPRVALSLAAAFATGLAVAAAGCAARQRRAK